MQSRVIWTAYVRPRDATSKPALILFLQLIFKIFGAVFSKHGLQHPAIGWELVPARWPGRRTLVWQGMGMSHVIPSLSWHQCCWPLSGNLGAGYQQVTLHEGSWCQEQKCDFKGTIWILKSFTSSYAGFEGHPEREKGCSRNCPRSAATVCPLGTGMATPVASCTPSCPGSTLKNGGRNALTEAL